ncbi:FMN-binding negative transcriptional regulator [Undibacterium griseum]|uniref:FMN-binding negative transcriptional regulator n=1 Tax=Undibacterium griseum TaxID=2762295 RepID=A0ABR6YRI8_9BURK|nr:FMN-binding negative transcriptional regulator [Undibacterium griseum]MBC3886506.1 FMN-binding negative transcriptional regulator [Undibacterium griseum]
MYLPPHFAEDRLDILHSLIQQHPLACLVTLETDGLTANHIPCLISPPTADAPFGTLLGHVAKANPVWRNTQEVLAVFQGASAYITPSWYEEKQQTGAVVPTYNYAVVHAHGSLQQIDSKPEFLSLLNQLTNHFESARQLPWQISDAPGDYIDNMMEMIVGIRMPIARLTGKWKTSQNKSVQTRSDIAAGLRVGTATEQAMAGIIESQLFE